MCKYYHPHWQMTKLMFAKCNIPPKFTWVVTGKSWIWRDLFDIKAWSVNRRVIFSPQWPHKGKESVTPDDSSHHNKPVAHSPCQRQGQTQDHSEYVFLPECESEKENENLCKISWKPKRDALQWSPTLFGPINIF